MQGNCSNSLGHSGFPSESLQGDILGQDAACQEWDGGRGLLLLTPFSSSSCRRGRAKSVNICKDAEHPLLVMAIPPGAPGFSRGWEDWHQLPRTLYELCWPSTSWCR